VESFVVGAVFGSGAIVGGAVFGGGARLAIAAAGGGGPPFSCFFDSKAATAAASLGNWGVLLGMGCPFPAASKRKTRQ